MDVRLPDMSGVDAARTLGRGERTARIPVVALSALPLENDADWRRRGVRRAMSRSRSASASSPSRYATTACRRKADAEPSVERCASTPAHAGGHGWQGRRVVLSSAGLGAGLTRRVCEHRRNAGGRHASHPDWRTTQCHCFLTQAHSADRSRGCRCCSSALCFLATALAACMGSNGDDSAAQTVRRVGLMHVGTDHVPPSLRGLKARLKELGWTEGKNIQLILRNLEPEQAEQQARSSSVSAWTSSSRSRTRRSGSESGNRGRR